MPRQRKPKEAPAKPRIVGTATDPGGRPRTDSGGRPLMREVHE